MKLYLALFCLAGLLAGLCGRLMFSLPAPVQQSWGDPRIGAMVYDFYQPESNATDTWRWSKPRAEIHPPVFGSVGMASITLRITGPASHTTGLTITNSWHPFALHGAVPGAEWRQYHLILPRSASNYGSPVLSLETPGFHPPGDARLVGIAISHGQMRALNQAWPPLLWYSAYVCGLFSVLGLILYRVQRSLVWLLNATLVFLIAAPPGWTQQFLGYQWLLVGILWVCVGAASFATWLRPRLVRRYAGRDWAGAFIVSALGIILAASLHWLLAALALLIVGTWYGRANSAPRSHRVASRRLRGALVSGGLALVYVAVQPTQAFLTITWMNMFHPSDFPTFKDVLHFYATLRTGIPPLLSLVEVLNYRWAGNLEFSHTTLFHSVCLVAWGSIVGFPQQVWWRWMLSAGLGFVFIASVARVGIHTYDLFFPACVLGAITLYHRAGTALRPRSRWLLFGAGFLLSMAELLRPFGLVVVLVLLGIMSYGLWQRRARASLFLALFIPVMVFSGSWHTWLLVRYQQITWTNNTGFNLLRSWQMVAEPALIAEPNARPVAQGRWENWNTPEHTENSNRLTRAVAHYMATHPIDSAMHILYRHRDVLWAVPTRKYVHDPQSTWFWAYRPLARASALIWMAALVQLAMRLYSSRRCGLLVHPHTLAIIGGSLTIFLLSIGEAGEESRFLASILPFLALLPLTSPPDFAVPHGAP